MLLALAIYYLSRTSISGSPSGYYPCNTSPLISDSLIPRDSIVDGQRQIADILTTCIATIFACTWTSIHPNIPSPLEAKWKQFCRHLSTFLCAIIAPELITTWALRQYFSARRVSRDYNNKFTNSSTFSENEYCKLAASSSGGGSEPCGRALPAYAQIIDFFKNCILYLPRAMLCPPNLPAGRKFGEAVPWSIKHGFFLQMGGFMLSKNSVPLFTLRFYTEDPIFDISHHILNNTIPIPTVTNDEISCRSKGDSLSKLLLIGHILWFALQCLVRWITGLAVTELEIVTLGYVVLNIITYSFWWHKPQSVDLPVYLEYSSEDVSAISAKILTKEHPYAFHPQTTKPQKLACIAWSICLTLYGDIISPLVKLINKGDKKVDTSKHLLRVPMFHYEECNSSLAVIVIPMTIVSVLFGLVHLMPACLLNVQPPGQRHICKFCAIVTMVIPLLLAICLAICSLQDVDMSGRHITYWRVVVVSIYFLARTVLLILTAMSISHIPDNALIDIPWLSSIPHF